MFRHGHHRVVTVGSLVLCATICVPSRARAQVDLSGEWASRLHEDRSYRQDPPGPDIGDYTGLPINEAARRYADHWDASILSLPEHQTRQPAAVYTMRGT